MDKATYTYKINKIQLKNGESFTPGRINVFVGANNCGKTQLLKDMLAFITGSKADPVILSELDITYPETWTDMENAYDMEIININQNPQLRHIVPTLDSNPKGVNAPNLFKSLESWLKSDQYAFRAATGDGLVTYLNTDNRLKLALRQPVQDLEKRGAKNVLEALYISGSSTTEKIKKYIRSIFGVEIYFNAFNLGMLEFRVGDDFSHISNNPQDAFKELRDFPLLDNQGDGLRSVLGIVTAILSVKKPIILLDEPEAFLHPPQAMQLGELISDLVEADRQIFIATHSADFLKGLIGSTKDAVIVHLNREKNVTRANVLDSITLNNIVVDPLLSSSRVLEGMFYKGVVATEGDADTVFYQRLFQKVGASDEIHFVNAHNKQTLKKIIDPYKKLGIKFAMIADADVIRDTHEFLEILKVTSDEKLINQICEERDAILNHFKSRSKYEIFSDLKDKTKEILDKYNINVDDDDGVIESVIFDYRSELKKIREEADELFEFKRSGRASLPDDLKNTFDKLWDSCSRIGLFIVSVGELESWLCDYGIGRTKNKSKWIGEALNKLYEIEHDPDKAVWQFVDALKAYFENHENL
ncbi:MAG: AAA family ATPase [Clostridiales bacterium]|nr:AAA family ATPase [Clostridiales bacterium]